jgi:hypothetical protein
MTCTGIAAGIRGATFVHCALNFDVPEFQQVESPKTIAGAVVHPVGTFVQLALATAPDELVEVVPMPTTMGMPLVPPPKLLEQPPPKAHISKTPLALAG